MESATSTGGRRNGRLEDRLVAALKPFGNRCSGRVEVIEGDITVDGCGLWPVARNSLHTLEINACVHSAGLMRFDDHPAKEIELSELVTEFLVHMEQKEVAKFSPNPVSPAVVGCKCLNQTATWNCEDGVLQ